VDIIHWPTSNEGKNTKHSMAFWVVMPCTLQTAQHFGGTYQLHLQDQRVSEARNQQKQAASRAFSKLHSNRTKKDCTCNK
jgi:hypothetical protein